MSFDSMSRVFRHLRASALRETTIILLAVAAPIGMAGGILTRETLASGHEPVTVEKILESYEKKRQEIKDFRIAFTRTSDDQAFRSRTIQHGEAAGAGTDLLRVDLKGEDNTDEATVLLSGKKLLWYDYKSKIKRVYHIAPLPPDDHFWPQFAKRIFQALDDHRLLFVGMPLHAVRERFNLRLYNDHDPNYFILEARPKKQEDLAECAVAYAALSRKTYLPRTFVVDERNGNRTQWDFAKFETNISPPITLELLSRNLPRNWEEIVYGEEVKPKK